MAASEHPGAVAGVAARARHQEQVETLCAAAARALSGDPALNYRSQRLHRGRSPLPWSAPHLHPLLGRDDFVAFRGAADGLALRESGSDAALHARLAPPDPVERMLFDLFEQYRVEAQAPEVLPGVRANLRHAFVSWSLAFHHAGLTDGAHGLLLYTVAQMVRARVTGEPVVEETEDLLEATRAGIGPLLGAALDGMRRCRGDQAAYAVHALALAAQVGELLRHSREEAGGRGEAGESPEQAAFALLSPAIGQATSSLASAVSGGPRVLAEAERGYRVFTRAYDQERVARRQVRPELLAEYRRELDATIDGLGVNLPRLVRLLRAQLALPAADGWDGGQEEGRIDGRRLAGLIASPTERRLFQLERTQPVADCALTVLLDCSGSMRQHAPGLAALLDVLVRALEMAGVSATEVLGFTTAAWNGGRAHRDWLRAGRPAGPGRLNELCHLVFKDADTPWRRARAGMAALLRPDLFREGVDGEALQWAARRLAARPESRKLLLVVSDGSPMDSATQLANGPDYLDQHLRAVAAALEGGGEVALYGVGIALDLGPYYARSHVLDLELSSANAVLQEIVALLGRRARR